MPVGNPRPQLHVIVAALLLVLAVGAGPANASAAGRASAAEVEPASTAESAASAATLVPAPVQVAFGPGHFTFGEHSAIVRIHLIQDPLIVDRSTENHTSLFGVRL